MILQKVTHERLTSLIAQAKELGKKTAPVWIELTEDMLTPVMAFMTLRRSGVPAFIFESVIGGEKTSRYSYMGFNPFAIFNCKGNQVEITTLANGGKVEKPVGDPRQILANEMEKYSMLTVPGLPEFGGGLVGNFGYDAVRLAEPTVPDQNPDELGLPDITLMYFDVIIAFDHVTKKIFVICMVPVDGDINTLYSEKMEYLEELHQQLVRPLIQDLALDVSPVNEAKSNMSKNEFMEMVRRCKEYIAKGDAFQIVVSQRFSCTLAVDPFTIYRVLRRTNPAPYLFFLDFGQWQMIGSSPEIMVQVIGRQVKISPIAGTRPRVKDSNEDERLGQELLADPKERAEHQMLVDLARNDVGRITKFGTVRVSDLMHLVRYSTVMHIVSDVIGELKDGISSLEALWASLPAGTLSGAPKVRAMQIIDELEKSRRGSYGGCVGFLGFGGDIETAIVIRTAVVANGIIYWQAGSGIVFDSDPETEYDESCKKGRSILNALVVAGNTRGGSF